MKTTETYNSLSSIVEQLESCNYECEGGNLNKNIAFIALKKIAYKEGCVNWGRKTNGHYGPCGKCAWCRVIWCSIK